MARANLKLASKALQSLKDNPSALKRFDMALTEIKHDIGIAMDDETFRYVANALITQKMAGDTNPLKGRKKKTLLPGGFQILAAIDAE